jgi:hypothetical protein
MCAVTTQTAAFDPEEREVHEMLYTFIVPGSRPVLNEVKDLSSLLRERSFEAQDARGAHFEH